MFAKGEKLESFIGHNTQFKGEISSKGTLRIDGNVEGNIQADWIIVGDKAFIKGNATATSIIIGGTVEGNVLAKGLVDVKKKGRIKGDIITSKLTVADGGMVDGRISMHNEGAIMIEMSEDAAIKENETAEVSQS
jgi:cytoskeletal protein CcmA (bactofilin family)